MPDVDRATAQHWIETGDRPDLGLDGVTDVVCRNEQRHQRQAGDTGCDQGGNANTQPLQAIGRDH